MIEVRIHGRGGQGAVIASQIIAEGAFREGMHVQAFPAFGSERRSAPVTAFVRLDHSPILVRNEIYNPDRLIVLDQNLITLGMVDITAGLEPAKSILINSPWGPAEFVKLRSYCVSTVDASGIARKHHLGTATAPIVNTAIAGAFATLVGIPSLDNLAAAIRSSVPIKPEENVKAALEGARSLCMMRAA
jgi:pyruvate ferredoxin oxidoreductase gamma subunit/2-oxoisovalerate ferredoxin oxidoreductase gamma subunit